MQLYAFDILALGQDLRQLPMTMRNTNLARLLRDRPDGIFVAPFEAREIGLLLLVHTQQRLERLDNDK
ncbi:ATP-dependent DNA ligase [Bradyrhizobium sp. S3.9.1]